MKQIVRQRMAARKRRIERRLQRDDLRGCQRPMIQAHNIHYELAGRSQGTCFGGIGAMHLLVQQLGLAKAIDERLHLLKIHLPYHESDHVLHFAYNALCDGTCLEDMELRRQDAAYLDALGARRLPDPTTAGDFCRRFQEHDLRTLMDVFNEIRLQLWKRQGPEFFEQAIIDVDGTLVGTTGECKQGMDYSYQGVWGYHPLVTSLANTGEVLSIVNRPGNRPSHEGAAEELDRAQDLCRQAGFRRILLRGDTDFTQTTELDRWTDDPRVQFIFGMDVQPSLHVLVDDSCEGQWKKLERPPRYRVMTAPRQRPENVKQQIVREREYRDIRLESEEVAELEYRPTACRKTYRLVAIRKNLSIEQGGRWLFDDYRYFFYLTNDRISTAAEIVYSANDRCNQENLHAQLKGGVRSLQAPVDGLLSNWAYMLMTSLAWNLKAWYALSLPETKGRWTEKHREERQTVLRMEFKTFRNFFIKVPCQIVRTGRKLMYRLLAWNAWQHVFFRLTDHLQC